VKKIELSAGPWKGFKKRLPVAQRKDKMRELVERYLRYHNGVAECESTGTVHECLCSVCMDARVQLKTDVEVAK
jgi:hypothetical protein